MTVSTIVLTKNEEKNIQECLKSLVWCNEVVVIDDNSIDATISHAKKQGAIVYTHSSGDDFSAQRNFGLEKAKGEWVLFVDADERVSRELRDEILHSVQDDTIHGFYIKRQDAMWGKVLQHGEQGNGKFLRLAKKDAGKWKGKVHEVWDIPGPTSTLVNPLKHFPHPTLAEFLQEINFYSTLRAQELHKKGIKTHWLDVLLYPKAKFLQDYFVKLGFLDGIEGFITALLMSFHSFLVRGKLWQLSKK